MGSTWDEEIKDNAFISLSLLQLNSLVVASKIPGNTPSAFFSQTMRREYKKGDRRKKKENDEEEKRTEKKKRKKTGTSC